MEPIPEDPEFGGGISPSRTSETTSVLREVYRSEKVEEIRRTVPVTYFYEEGTPEMDEQPRYYVSSPDPSQHRHLQPAELEGSEPQVTATSYSYSYESSYDKPPETSFINGGAISNGIIPSPEEIPEGGGAIVERHQTQTQKVTRMTKVTTTRAVEEIHDQPDYTGYSYESNESNVTYDNPYVRDVPTTNGNGPPAVAAKPNGLVHEIKHRQQQLGMTSSSSPPSSDTSPNPATSVTQNEEYIPQYALPSCPGVPQPVDVDSNEVTLVWLRPDRDGDMGDVEGYQVQYRRTDEGDGYWRPAHDDLITDTQCTVSNLEPNSECQFRIVAKNPAGFGEASTPSSVIQLRPKYEDYTVPISVPTSSQNFKKEPAVPYPPSRPELVSMDGTRVSLAWEPPIFSGRGGPVAGYQVEYRPSGQTSWMTANDRLVTECQCTVDGLRPNGEYEFRIFARNAEGLSEPSQSSGFHRMRPLAPPRSPNTFIPASVGGGPFPPSQPQVIDADTDSATLIWAPPPVREGSRIIGYILESREIGDPNWYSVYHGLITGTQFSVKALRPNSTYEFRVFSKGIEGISDPSEVSELVQLRPKLQGPPRGVPARPQPPEIMDNEGDRVTICWLPTHSSLPIQGYDMDFRDVTEDPKWYKLNDLLMQNCRMTIGELTPGHCYEFRVHAKNAMGYSEPSEPSIPITIGLPYSEPPNPYHQAPPELQTRLVDTATPLQNPPLQRESSTVAMGLADELVRESPPIPDRDDSPPPIHRPPMGNQQESVTWRDPTLPEVLEYLSSPNNVIRLNAAGYLQHLTYNDSENKEKTRKLGGVPRLIDMLTTDIPEIQKNACGCIRNLSYGRDSDENKKAIAQGNGIPALASLLRKTPDNQVKEEITGALWNLSSSDELKNPILDYSLEPLIRNVIIPGSGYSPGGDRSDPHMSYSPNVFRNGTGVIRNVSALGERSRKVLRDAPDLIDSLVSYLTSAVMTRKEYDNKIVENVVCILRNLSYRCQEIEDPNYDAHPPTTPRDPRSKSAPSGSPKVKPKKESKLFGKKKSGRESGNTPSPSTSRPSKGVALLWDPDTVRDYMTLLKEASNHDTLEASAGAIQNLVACYWQPSIDIRALVRKERGLPVFVELLRVDADKVVCAIATAMRNLALDPSNRELIGNYAMKDLVNKLPDRPPDRFKPSNQTLSSILGVLYETILHNAEFARNLHEKKGTERLVFITRTPQYWSKRVVRYASQVLNTMYQHRELHSLLLHKDSGFKEADFILRSGAGAAGDAMTLARPISTQGPERGRGLRPDLDDSFPSTSARHSQGPPSDGRSSIHDTSFQSQSGRGPPPPQHHQQVPMRPVNGNQNNGTNGRPPPPHHSNGQKQYPPSHRTNGAPQEPLYAQVQKRNSREQPQHSLYGRNSGEQPAGDSWV